MKPVCVPCARFFRVKKSGYCFVEAMPVVNPALPGNAEPEKWRPYKLWAGDLWECEGCGSQIVDGFGKRPVAEHFESGFLDLIEKLPAKLQVNDY